MARRARQPRPAPRSAAQAREAEAAGPPKRHPAHPSARQRQNDKLPRRQPSDSGDPSAGRHVAVAPGADWGWFTRRQVAEFCGYRSEESVRKLIEPLLRPGELRRGKGGLSRTLYQGAGVIEAIRRREREATIAAAGGDPDMAAGVDSPALERFRLAKAQLAELDLRRQRGELVDRSAIRRALQAGFGILRAGIEALRRQWGNDAGDLVEEHLKAAEAESMKGLSTEG